MTPQPELSPINEHAASPSAPCRRSYPNIMLNNGNTYNYTLHYSHCAHRHQPPATRSLNYSSAHILAASRTTHHAPPPGQAPRLRHPKAAYTPGGIHAAPSCPMWSFPRVPDTFFSFPINNIHRHHADAREQPAGVQPSATCTTFDASALHRERRPSRLDWLRNTNISMRKLHVVRY